LNSRQKRHGFLQHGFISVKEQDLMSGRGSNLSNAPSHGSGAHDAHCHCVHHIADKGKANAGECRTALP
jgi:hypothetical protein